MKNIFRDKRGFSTIAIVAIVVAVLAVGGIGYYVYSKNNDKNGVNEAAKQKEASCTNTDKNICKYFAATTKVSDNMSSVTTTTGSDGEVTKFTFQLAGGNSYIKTEGGQFAYEVITIGDSTYTKGGDTWWKQTAKPEEKQAVEDYKIDAKEDETAVEEDKTQYKLIGEEACGDLTCFKYQVIDPKDTSGETVFIWFDTKDYLLRKQTSDGPNGKSESVYSYGNIKVSEPSPIKDIPEGQYLLPGQAEPTAVPSFGQ